MSGPARTRAQVVLDVPEQAVLRLASTLRLHKPDRRLRVSRDPLVVKRLVIALTRPAPWEGILDAYVLEDSLVAILGDVSVREFPIGRLPKVGKLERREFRRFEIDSAGSYLYWPCQDVHMGPSQMLQAVDPVYMADVQIRRYGMDNVSQALEDMRNDRRLKQTEIVGLSERHVRRLEKEEVRLTVEAATRFAGAFGLTLSGFLDELSERITALRGDCDDSAARRSGRSQSIAAHPVTPPAHHLAPGAGVRSTRAADRCSLRGSAKR